MIVDTHTHVVASDDARYPLRPSGVGSQWFRDTPCSAEELAELTAASGVDAVVLVQAFGAYTYDNTYVVDSAAARPERFVSIAIVDAEDPTSPATLSALAHEKAFTGVRLFSIGALERPQPTWLDQPVTFEVWQVCADARPPRRGRAASRSICHACGACSSASPSNRSYSTTAASSISTADRRTHVPPSSSNSSEHTNLHLKVTSHVLEAADGDGDACEIVDRLVGEFGAERLVWGSDYPQTHDRSYPELVALARHACRNLSERDRGFVLGDTALRLWPELAR